ncbi:MAG: hypothetical protein L6V93_05760 [Clostridiales bacterium]|nr:MAG: hypothetical protein L6V93_05760 [Clostridiales bacterium]
MRGFSLAHTTWLAPGKYGYKGHQVQNTWVTNDCAKYMPGTIKLEWANNINFKNNHIYDHGMSAVDFEKRRYKFERNRQCFQRP